MSAICFDLDGTLTDPKEGIVRSIQYALGRLGVSPMPDADDLLWCIGPPLLESLKKLLGDAERARMALSFYRERFADIGLYENKIYPGIRELLAALKSIERTTFVATSKPTIYAEKIIHHFSLSGYFDTIYGSELDGTRSYKSDLLAWVLRQEQLEAKTTIMVGDRSHDMIALEPTECRL